MLDRIERTDILNALALAVALLVLGLGMLALAGSFRSTLDEGVIDSERPEPVDAEIEFEILAVPSEEIVVRVGNATEGRQGLAGLATRRIQNQQYGVLEPINVDEDFAPVDESSIYFVGLDNRIHAIQIAQILNVDETRVQPLNNQDVGMPTEGASILVVLGQSVSF